VVNELDGYGAAQNCSRELCSCVGAAPRNAAAARCRSWSPYPSRIVVASWMRGEKPRQMTLCGELVGSSRKRSSNEPRSEVIP
jgi:hypothetical protein